MRPPLYPTITMSFTLTCNYCNQSVPVGCQDGHQCKPGSHRKNVEVVHKTDEKEIDILKTLLS